MATLKKLRVLFICACLLGISLSLYAYYVERVKELYKDDYRAMCDFSETMSCSKVFTSRFGRGFGLVEHLAGKDSFFNQPNSVFGLGFYSSQLFLIYKDTTDNAAASLVTTVIANLGSVYLAYILYFVLNDFCVVCVSTYIVNASLLVLAILRLKKLTEKKAK